ncbi:MAG: hypothetical protein IT278_04180, partial [Ignavibacteriaceae bacterium]|nr:hypothetical protein [Ignavibacteriaceae bacterium]
IEVSFKKSNDQQTAFICYGIMLESTNENGVLYASTGVNGAGLEVSYGSQSLKMK